MYQFSQTTFDILSSCGWSPERRVSTDVYEAYFKETGQPFSDVVLEFLASFGGLEINYPNKHYPDVVLSFSVDPVESLYDLFEGDLKDFSENWIRKPVCAVAYARYEDVLLMTPTGEFYFAASMFHWFTKYGNSVVEAFENICVQQSPIETIDEVSRTENRTEDKHGGS